MSQLFNHNPLVYMSEDALMACDSAISGEQGAFGCDQQEEDSLFLDVAHGIGQLPQRQQTVVRLRLVDDQSFQVIARSCGIETGTARATYRDGIRSLRRSLATDRCRGDR